MSDENQKINAVIMEIRAGVGGEEAALFANDLYRMYTRYAQNQGWSVETFDLKQTDINGIKEVIFEIKGDDVYNKLKNEAGVHRVQRVPKTEKSGRVHTSTATVAVLAKPKSTEINIRPQDIRQETCKSGGAGGQYVNKRMTAIRLVHIPTGIVVESQSERSLQQNRENALSVLAARLLKKQQEQLEQQVIGTRRQQIGTAGREEKIRTYNFPQDRITDHRLNKSWHDIEAMMDGKIDKMIDKVSEGLK
ncbi:MAG TPA: PCRF domain-containing protein [Candidatus Pacearchaeota archaeon]|jgi:peptide chain release factor 1|nr:PCRF domain-containing protein [Candidatus Pacearchaeota archaeon]HRR95059.1 PCRF domain-containing protein [Candidatus Paceibacterota bacterium]HPC30772.1 PCRF domain-containing protein [Candidatus Pacearchaeota archaeon]HQG09242.1 PCRF domain-containing protein [Candidatus Pacearchaeota archaeon]HQH20370.1 PCRF domain-containing protein [Candidatus Pacearchaeota archaeon]